MVFPWFSHGFPIVFPWFQDPRPPFSAGQVSGHRDSQRHDQRGGEGQLSMAPRRDFWRFLAKNGDSNGIGIGMGWDVLITMCWNMEHGIIN